MHFIPPEPMTGKTGPIHRQIACLDPVLRHKRVCIVGGQKAKAEISFREIGVALPLFLQTIEESGFSTWLRESDLPFAYYFILLFHTFGLASGRKGHQPAPRRPLIRARVLFDAGCLRSVKHEGGPRGVQFGTSPCLSSIPILCRCQ